MASPVQAPPQPPARYRRSWAGPVVLIIMGVIFLLGTMGRISWWSLGHWFAHYWPVLLIVWGVIKLIEYQQAQRQGVRAAGIGVGGVCLLICLILFGLMATQAARFNWDELRDQINIDDSDFTIFGQKYSYEDQLSQAFPAGASLHVNDTRGAVNIISSDDNQIQVVVHKHISAESQSEADKWNAGTKPQLTVSGNVITLNANNQGAGDHWVAVDMDVTLPRKAAVNISTRYGDVNVTGRDADVQIAAQHDDVSTSDIKGKVDLNLDYSSARISQIASDVSIEGRANDVSIDEVKGGLHLNGEFMESVKLAKIAQSVTFRSSRTDLEFARLDGDLDLDSGDLQASDIAGPVRLTTRSKDIRLSGISGDVRLQDENGSVELHMNKLGSMQVQNRKGDIQVYVPDKAGFQLDAHTENGDIDTDFKELKVDSHDDNSSATGTIGSGGPQLVFNDQHGDIELRKGSSVAEAEPAAPNVPKVPHAPKAPRPPTVTEN